jgi:hypothetical protein
MAGPTVMPAFTERATALPGLAATEASTSRVGLGRGSYCSERHLSSHLSKVSTLFANRTSDRFRPAKTLVDFMTTLRARVHSTKRNLFHPFMDMTLLH